MILSLSEISTVSATFREDLRAYAAAGFDGIGIWEMKLGDDEEGDLEAFRASGLKATNCVPAESLDPAERRHRRPGGRRRAGPLDLRLDAPLRAVRPDCVLCLTGPAGDRDEDAARSLVIDGLRRVAAAADNAGVRLGLEPIHASQRDALTLVSTIPQTLELLYEAGLPDVGVMVDLWHVWDTPDIERHLAENVDRFTGVHVGDWFARGSRRPGAAG